MILINNILKYLEELNILNHQYVPRHTILSDDEVGEMMKKYNVMEKSQLPDISRYDPVALAIGMRPARPMV